MPPSLSSADVSTDDWHVDCAACAGSVCRVVESVPGSRRRGEEKPRAGVSTTTNWRFGHVEVRSSSTRPERRDRAARRGLIRDRRRELEGVQGPPPDGIRGGTRTSRPSPPARSRPSLPTTARRSSTSSATRGSKGTSSRHTSTSGSGQSTVASRSSSARTSATARPGRLHARDRGQARSRVRSRQPTWSARTHRRPRRPGRGSNPAP